jgi:hypothetical protein
LRYTLLASAGLVALCAFAVHTPAAAADCGCAPAVRSALAKEKVVRRAPMPAMKPVMKAAARRPVPHMARRAPTPAGDCGCRDTVRAALAKEKMVPSASYAANSYDYGAAGAVDSYPYTHHWTVAPQGYVPPMAMNAPMVPAYEGPADLPPDAPMSYAPPDGAATAYADGYGDSRYQQGITVEQQGWIGGVGYGREGGGGGGGGGGMTLTLSQPDSLNGPSYNNFGQSYGGDTQSAGQVNTWRTQAFTPPANSGSGSK